MRVEERVAWRAEAYAGFWQRAAALLIDLLLVGAVLSVLALLLIGGGAGEPGDTGLVPDAADAVFNLLAFVGYFLYDTILTSRQGATIGKRAAGIEVRTLDGALPRFPLSAVRFFARVVSALPLLLGFLWAAFDVRKQTFHDKVCSTVVVRRAITQPASASHGVEEAVVAAPVGSWGATPATDSWSPAAPDPPSTPFEAPFQPGPRGTTMESAVWGSPSDEPEPISGDQPGPPPEGEPATAPDERVEPAPGPVESQPAPPGVEPASGPAPGWSPAGASPYSGGYAAPEPPPELPPAPPSRPDDPNLVAVDRARLAPESAEWLRQVAAQVDPRLRRVNPTWSASQHAQAARACTFGILIGHLARMHPHMAADLSRVAEVHPSYSTLLEGSRLATLEQIAADLGRATAWLGPLIDVEDPQRVAALLA